MAKRRTDAYREAYIARLLENLHPANEATIREYIQAKQAQGLKSASLMNIAVCLARLDSEAVGESILALDPGVLTSVLERYAHRHSPSSAAPASRQVGRTGGAPAFRSGLQAAGRPRAGPRFWRGPAGGGMKPPPRRVRSPPADRPSDEGSWTTNMFGGVR